MKTTTYLAIIILVFSQYKAFSQNEYFANDPRWGIDRWHQWAPFEPIWGEKTTFYVDGDTLLNEELFVKIFEEGVEYTNGGEPDYVESLYSNPLPLAYLRSEGMKMYRWSEELSDKELLYDFDVAVGDTFHVSSHIYNGIVPPVVMSVGNITVGGVLRKFITVSTGTGEPISFDYIEGVGHWRGLWYENGPQLESGTYLLCFSLNGESYFVNPEEINWLEPSAENCEFVVGVQDVNTLEIKVYPNPFDGFISIQGNLSIESVTIFDLRGKALMAALINKREGKVDTDEIESGIYIIRIVYNNGETITRRLLKE